MRAAIYTRYGPPEVVRVDDIERPSLGDDQLPVRVDATTVNRTYCGYRAGKPFIVRFFSGLRNPKAQVLGCQFAGEVEAVASRADVDEVISQANAAGATVIDPPHDRPWSIYSGYFQDPDGHLWEVIWNPALDLGTSRPGYERARAGRSWCQVRLAGIVRARRLQACADPASGCSGRHAHLARFGSGDWSRALPATGKPATSFAQPTVVPSC